MGAQQHKVRRIEKPRVENRMKAYPENPSMGAALQQSARRWVREKGTTPVSFKTI
jgi:hypothetical protein